MRHWSFWDWVAYLCLLLGAMILAADTGLRVAPELAQHLPLIGRPFWGFAPFALVLIATLILVARKFGWAGSLFGVSRPLRLFLERDSVTDQVGIQSFPGISYIQISFTSKVPVTKCRTWMTRAEFSEDNIAPYALEHNERHPLKWSKHGGANEFETDINPGDPAVRNNVLVFDKERLQFDYGTPTNLLPLLQRIGFHRLTIVVNALRNGQSISETRLLTVNWRGRTLGAVVSMK
jgi:hypothetical protein